MSRNPIQQDTDGWYFWEETWAEQQGPFDSKREAKKAWREYCRTQLGD